jgi:hypothetical protein
MWLAVGIAIPIIWIVVIVLCDMFRDSLNQWMDWYLYMFTVYMPWIAIVAGVIYIAFR